METKKRTTIWNRGYTCAFLANLLLCFSQNTVNPLISTYATWLGAGAVLVGTISGLYFGVAFAARPISGPAITILDKKKLMVATYTLGFLTNIGYALAGSVPVFIAARVVHGLQFAFVGSLNLTIASDNLPREKLGSGIGIFGIGGALATAIGPSIGIAVRNMGEALWGERAGYTAVFLMGALFMLLGVIPCALLPLKKQSKAERAALGKWYQNILAVETIPASILLGLISLSNILYSTYMVPYAEELGIENIGLFFTVYAIFLLGARPLFGRLSDRVGMDKVMYPSLIIFALSFVAAGFGRSIGWMLVAAILDALGYGALNPTIQTLCIRTVEAERRGVASNTQYFGMDLGYFVGPMIGGMLYKSGTYSTMYLYGGIVPLAVAFIIFAVIWPKQKNHLY